MSTTNLPPDVMEFLNKFLQQPGVDALAFSQLLIAFSKTILTPLITVLDTIQTLQQLHLSAAEQKEGFAQMQHASTEILGFVNNLITFSQSGFSTINKTALFSAAALPENDIPHDELNGVRTLLIDDDVARRSQLCKQLQSFGMECTLTTADNALQLMRLAEQKHESFQIIAVSGQFLDHHTNYLARTIKANPAFNNIMLTLILPGRLPDFEKERALFNGFACVLCPADPALFLKKLVNAWHSWSVKINYIHAEDTANQNRILLVEDDPIPQKVTQRQLHELGFDVDIAPDGHTALKLLEKKSYDLIFMDIGLPDISGLEVTAEIRKRQNSIRHLPIIGLTIYALESDEETGLQAGMDDYVVKPLLQDRLKSVLDQWIKT